MGTWPTFRGGADVGTIRYEPYMVSMSALSELAHLGHQHGTHGQTHIGPIPQTHGIYIPTLASP